MQKKLENSTFRNIFPFCGIELDDGTYHLPYNYLGERPTHLIVTYLLDLAEPSKVLKIRRGSLSNVVGIICPPPPWLR